MDQATQRPRFRTDVAMGVLLAWGVCALLYLDVAARLEAGASDGLAAWLRAATRGGVISPLDAWASAMRRLACAVTLVSLPFVFPAMWRDRRALAARVVGESTKETVAFLRIVVATILLVTTFVEDLPSVARLPASAARPKGVMLLVLGIPGVADAARSPAVLQGLVWGTRGLLGLSLLGLGGRRMVLTAAVSTFLFGGLLRTYANAFHAGLLPIWLLLVLACFRCTDAWSLDAWQSGPPQWASSGERRAHYGWARYTFFGVLSLAYVAAGASKLFNGGPWWWEPDNLRVILAMDALNPMELPFRVGLPMATGPAWPLALLGLAAVLTELGMLGMLFSQRARWVMPAAMLATHVGIAVMQNVLFADLILVLGLYYAQVLTDRCSPCASTFLRRRTAPDVESPDGSADGHVITLGAPSGSARDTRPFMAFASVFLVANLAGVEFYPLTGMQMYSRRNHDGVVRYNRIVTVDDRGREREALPQQWVRALRDSRCRFHLHRCFGEGDDGLACDDFMRGFAHHLETTGTPDANHVVALEVQEWRWSIRDHRDDPDHGAVSSRVRIPIVGRRVAHAP
ncbi:MAG: hypothetical protein R3B40_27935 [Polyangiales bacterium]